jgi:hypothetical protein
MCGNTTFRVYWALQVWSKLYEKGNKELIE